MNSRKPISKEYRMLTVKVKNAQSDNENMNNKSINNLTLGIVNFNSFHKTSKKQSKFVKTKMFLKSRNYLSWIEKLIMIYIGLSQNYSFLFVIKRIIRIQTNICILVVFKTLVNRGGSRDARPREGIAP